MMMTKIFIFVEVREEKIHPVSLELLRWGRELLGSLPGELVALVLTHHLQSPLEELIHHGADRVEFFTHPHLSVFDARTYTQILY
ncbi:MAG: hypothetical protein N2Z84_00450, partial [Atribacterota bacterium]|nr:hypothetical protein [Atribacterota bacterium]